MHSLRILPIVRTEGVTTMRRNSIFLTALATGFLAGLLLSGDAFSQTASVLRKPKVPSPPPPQVRHDLSSLILPSRGAPPKPVHCCAEWEESEGIILNYGWMNADTVYKMQLDHQVYIPVDNQTKQDNYIDFLKKGITITPIVFLITLLTLYLTL